MLCYYTDTDSVVLSNPLPEEFVSSTELGKFKLECKARSEAIFLAPKSYYIMKEDDGVTLKHKGAARAHVDQEWYIQQYQDLSMVKKSQLLITLEAVWKIWLFLNQKVSLHLVYLKYPNDRKSSLL